MAKLAKLQDQRTEPRIRVRWHAEAFIDGQGVYRGFIKEISMTGTGIFLYQNVQMAKSLRLRIYMPPLSKTSVLYTMDVSAKVIFTALDSYESLFHTGLHFTQFYLPTDQDYLQARIATLI